MTRECETLVSGLYPEARTTLHSCALAEDRDPVFLETGHRPTTSHRYLVGRDSRVEPGVRPGGSH